MFPIQQTDFYLQDRMENDLHPDVCMSEHYFTNVLQAKIKEMK